MNINRAHSEHVREPLIGRHCQENALPRQADSLAPANNSAVGGQRDTARGRLEPPQDQSPPSRSITLPLEHVRRLLAMAVNGKIPDDLDMAIVRETHMRMADVYAGLS